jgi:hypothetical protein
MSLDASYTLPVDTLNNGTPTNQTVTEQDRFQDRSVYKWPLHSLTMRDLLSFFRAKPTRNGNFHGVAKSSFKVTTDQVVAGVDSTTNVTAPLIGEVSFSLPVGTTAANAKILRQRLIAVLDNDALMVKLMEQVEI